jgi:hypothetical protein
LLILRNTSNYRAESILIKELRQKYIHPLEIIYVRVHI